ncbi:MAG: hypothetical protein ACUVTF_03410 [bacterium]
MDKHSILPNRIPKDFWALFATSVINAIGFSITMPYMSLYLNNVLKQSMTTVGILLMITQVVGASGGNLGWALGPAIPYLHPHLIYDFYCLGASGIAHFYLCSKSHRNHQKPAWLALFY